MPGPAARVQPLTVGPNAEGLVNRLLSGEKPPSYRPRSAGVAQG